MRQRTSMRGGTVRALWQIRAGRNAVLLLALLALAALVGPLLLPQAPETIDPSERLAPPSLAHPFGTDELGRDVFTRVIYGARVSLLVGVTGSVLALVVGVALGAASGYAPRWIDEVLMRVLDVVMSFPFIVLAIALAYVIGPSIGVLVLIVAVTQIPNFARITRAGVLEVRSREFVSFSRTTGRRSLPIVWQHVLPNTMAPVLAFGSLAVGNGINIEAALSFLGVGIQPPTPSWGSTLSEGSSFLSDAPWITVFPGLAICLSVLVFTVLADVMRDVMDPASRDRPRTARRRRLWGRRREAHAKPPLGPAA